MTVSQIVNNPATYNGRAIRFSARTINFLQDASGITTAMNVTDPNDPSSVLYVQLSPGADPTKMNKGDMITVWGFGVGTLSAKNAFGAAIIAPAVSEIYLSDAKTGYEDIAADNP